MSKTNQVMYHVSYKLTWKSPTSNEIYYSDPIQIDGPISFTEGTKLLDKFADEEVIRLQKKGIEVLEVVKTYKKHF